MSILKWILLLPLWLLVNLLAYLLAPILPAFAEQRNGPLDNANSEGIGPRLPSWLSWWDTFDNSLHGDFGWRNEHCKEGWDTYWGMVKWLWRNPAYGFERSVISAKILPNSVVYCSGDKNVRDKPQGVEGYCYTTVGNYWNLVWVKKFSSNMCFHFNFGWKLKTYAEDPSRTCKEPIAQYVFSPRFSSFKE